MISLFPIRLGRIGGDGKAVLWGIAIGDDIGDPSLLTLLGASFSPKTYKTKADAEAVIAKLATGADAVRGKILDPPKHVYCRHCKAAVGDLIGISMEACSACRNSTYMEDMSDGTRRPL